MCLLNRWKHTQMNMNMDGSSNHLLFSEFDVELQRSHLRLLWLLWSFFSGGTSEKQEASDPFMIIFCIRETTEILKGLSALFLLFCQMKHWCIEFPAALISWTKCPRKRGQLHFLCILSRSCTPSLVISWFLKPFYSRSCAAQPSLNSLSIHSSPCFNTCTSNPTLNLPALDIHYHSNHQTNQTMSIIQKRLV